MKVLGIGHDLWISSACLIVDGKLMGALPEERLNRQKGFQGFPLKAINQLLKENNLHIEDIDKVCIGWNPSQYFNALHPRFSKLPRWRAEMLYAIPNYIQSMHDMELDPMKTNITVDGIRAEMEFIDHHKCHSYCSHFLSDFDESINISIDGRGERRTSSINIIKDNEYAEISNTLYPNSLGLFYGAFTQYTGFRPHSDEWKFMALGALFKGKNKNKYYDRIKDIVKVDDLTIMVDGDWFSYDQPDVYGKSWFKKNLISKIGLEPLKKWKDSIRNAEEYYELAHAVQTKFEEIVFKLIENAHKRCGIKNVTITGGCAMNSLLNGKLHNRFRELNFYIPPYPDDSGIAIGAGIIGSSEEVIKKWAIPAYTYTGSKYTNSEIKSMLDNYKINYKERGGNWRYIAQSLSEGKIVGLFQGRSEFGQRSLGNRSIIADPRTKETKDRLNRAIKFREGFRPFAPSVMKEYGPEIFENYVDTFFMERVLQVKKQWREKIAAVVHDDGSARLQTVTHQINPNYYELIKTFEELTGIPLIVNTSLNLNGEPNVESPEDAIRTFMTCGMDILVLEDFYIEKDSWLKR